MKAHRLAVEVTLIALVVGAASTSAQSLLSSSSSVQQPFAQQSLLSPWTPPPIKPLACGPFCSSAFGGTTPTEQGAGSTCSNAVTALDNELRQIAGASCMAQNGTSKCNVVFTYTIGCTETGGAWNVSGYATYNCIDTTC